MKLKLKFINIGIVILSSSSLGNEFTPSNLEGDFYVLIFFMVKYGFSKLFKISFSFIFK